MNGAERLLGFPRGGDAEGDAAVVIGFFGSGEVEVAERDLLRVLRREVPESLADDGVIADLLLTLIAEDEDSGGKDRVCGIFRA